MSVGLGHRRCNFDCIIQFAAIRDVAAGAGGLERTLTHTHSQPHNAHVCAWVSVCIQTCGVRARDANIHTIVLKFTEQNCAQTLLTLSLARSRSRHI